MELVMGDDNHDFDASTRIRILEAAKVELGVKLRNMEEDLRKMDEFIDRRIELVDQKFDKIETRLRSIEVKIYAAAGALAALQLILTQATNYPGFK